MTLLNRIKEQMKRRREEQLRDEEKMKAHWIEQRKIKELEENTVKKPGQSLDQHKNNVFRYLDYMAEKRYETIKQQVNEDIFSGYGDIALKYVSKTPYDNNCELCDLYKEWANNINNKDKYELSVTFKSDIDHDEYDGSIVGEFCSVKFDIE